MPYRKTLVQQRFRLREGLLAKLERDAKRNDRSLNDEVVQRLEESYERDDWRETRERWFEAIRRLFVNHPDSVTAFLPIYEKIEEEVEADMQSVTKRDVS